MTDRVTVVTRKGLFTRLGESLGGIVVGLVLGLAAFPVLWLNEGRSVRTHTSLQEGRSAIVEASADAVDPANEGRLVHVTGRAATGETLADPDFPVSANALALVRHAEMYQWIERKESRTREKIGGGEETVTTFTYERAWRPRPVDSAGFHERAGHENPTMRFASGRWNAREATLGAFRLGPDLVAQVSATAPLPFGPDAMARLPEDARARARADGGALYLGPDPSRPAVGDLRVRFEVVPPGDVSVIAAQSGGGFAPYQTSAGDALLVVREGRVSADGMFTQAESANAALTWVLRGVGFLLLVFAVTLLLRPIRLIAGVIPLLGRLVGAGVGLIALAIAAPVSLVVIAIAWVFYRPVVGIGLLVAAAVVFFAIRMLAARKPPALQTQSRHSPELR